MAFIEETLLTDIVHKSDLQVSASGDLDIISGLSNIKNALFHRLITVKGSLMHRPDYGVGIKNFQNAAAVLSVQRKIAGLIQEQFEKDPRVEGVKSVRVIVDDLVPHQITLVVKVDIVGYGEVEAEYTPFGEGI